MNFNSPWAWLGWAVLVAVPILILLLYFLKLRRQRLQVPSTLLWRRTLEDLQVNSLWQRLRSSLLLWLQLLVAILLLLSVLPIGCQSEQTIGQRHLFVLDTSASMTAVDGGVSRLELAKRQIDARLSELRDYDLAMLMTCDDQVQIFQTFTADRSLLRRKLQDITTRPRLTNMEDAVRSAVALTTPVNSAAKTSGDVADGNNEGSGAATGVQPATLHLYSDGGFPALKASEATDVFIEWHPIGQALVTNLGITTFNAQWNERKPEVVDLFARVENVSSTSLAADVELRRNGQVIDVIRRDNINPGTTSSLDFQDILPAQLDAVTEYELRLIVEDDLTVDNSAYCVVNPARKPRILLITPGNDGLESVLSTTLIAEGVELVVEGPEFLLSATYQELVEQPLYDLVVFDRMAPPQLPLANTMTWAVAPSAEWKVTPAQPPVFVLFGNNTHPLTANLNLDALGFLSASSIQAPPGSSVLLTAADGPLIVIGPRENFQDLVLGFPLLLQEDGQWLPNTDWPSRITFPVFMYNTLELLGRLGQKEIASSIRPGQWVRFKVGKQPQSLTTVSPSGIQQELRSQTDGSFLFNAVDELGIHRILDNNGQHLRSVAVSLSDRRESDIAVKEQTLIGNTAIEPAETTTGEGTNLIWRYILLTALVALFAEWIVYNRRILL